jgi:hypothetical protein
LYGCETLSRTLKKRAYAESVGEYGAEEVFGPESVWEYGAEEVFGPEREELTKDCRNLRN